MEENLSKDLKGVSEFEQWILGEEKPRQKEQASRWTARSAMRPVRLVLTD